MRSLVCLFSALVFTGCSDKSPPTWPADGMLEIETTASSATLEWPVAIDDTAVTRIVIRLGDGNVAELAGDATDYEATGLNGETALRFAVVAVDEAGNSSEPLEGSGLTLDGTAPRWPAGSVLEHVDGMFRWSAANDSTGVSAYVLKQGDEELTRTSTGMFAFEGDPSGAFVIAYDAAGNESGSLAWQNGQTLEDVAEVIQEALPEVMGNPTLARPLSPRLGNAVGRLRDGVVPRLDRNRIKNERLQAISQMRSLR
jgi:hypothetical protein